MKKYIWAKAWFCLNKLFHNKFLKKYTFTQKAYFAQVTIWTKKKLSYRPRVKGKSDSKLKEITNNKNNYRVRARGYSD